MSLCNRGRFRQQVRFLQRQFLQDGDLPFTDVLSEGTVTQALKELNVVWLDRVYSPLVTLWAFRRDVMTGEFWYSDGYVFYLPTVPQSQP